MEINIQSKTIYSRGWRDGIEIKTIHYSNREPEFDSLNPNATEQPSATQC